MVPLPVPSASRPARMRDTLEGMHFRCASRTCPTLPGRGSGSYARVPRRSPRSNSSPCCSTRARPASRCSRSPRGCCRNSEGCAASAKPSPASSWPAAASGRQGGPHPRRLRLGAALSRGRAQAPGVIAHPEDAARLLALRLRGQPREVFVGLFLDQRHRVIACEELALGTVHEAVVHPREVVRACIRHNAAALIVAHNHPSGSPNRVPRTSLSREGSRSASLSWTSACSTTW